MENAGPCIHHHGYTGKDAQMGSPNSWVLVSVLPTMYSKEALGSEELTSHGNMLEMHNFRLYLKSTESQSALSETS